MPSDSPLVRAHTTACAIARTSLQRGYFMNQSTRVCMMVKDFRRSCAGLGCHYVIIHRSFLLVSKTAQATPSRMEIDFGDRCTECTR